MRKLGSAFAVAAGLTLLAGPAQAHAQDDKDYPPSSGRLAVSESTLSPGEPFTVSGDGAKPGATVTFTLQRSPAAVGTGQVLAAGSSLVRSTATNRPQAEGSIPLGSTTDADGQFSATLIMPAGTEAGVYGLSATSSRGILAVMTLQVITGGGGIGGLPFSGANVLPGLAMGAALIVVGGLLLLSLKRRRPAA
jgi:hypothetical protein